MSKFLSFECDPIDQPAATDPVEKRTWCALRIRVGGRTVTRIWDRGLEEERSFLYVPAFPIAEWVVQHWWTLLNEPSRTEELPRASAVQSRLPWIKRHCLRSAESGLLLPAFYLFNDGHGIRAEWQADERGTLPHMPGEFIESGFSHLDLTSTADALARFVNEILGRVRGMEDERVKQLQRNWQAIQEADSEEVKFCVVAGRMGVDPYDLSEMTDALGSFIEDTLNDPDFPLQRDLTEVAQAEWVADQWSWVQRTTATLKLGRSPTTFPVRVHAVGLSPSQYGYQLAEKVRSLVGLDPSEPVRSVEDTARAITDEQFRAEDSNHVPGHGVRAVVGWTRDRGVIVAGPRSPRPDNYRFLLARGLYHALFACDQSERLVTDAYTWDQQASRAFAAEFLAPQEALTVRTQDSADRATVERLADEFQASTMLIERQLQNAGVPLVDE